MATIIPAIKALPVSINAPIPLAEGARGFQIRFDFTGSAQQQMNVNSQDFGMSHVQTLFIDNSDSADTTSIEVGGTNQTLTCPPYSQGFFPVLLSGPNLNMTLNCGGVCYVPIFFLNVYLAMQIWSVRTPGAVSGVVTVDGTVYAAPQAGSYTSRNGTIAIGGTSQLLCPANGARKRLFIQNPYTAAGEGGIASAETLYVRPGAAAGINNGTSIEIYPGGSFDTGVGPISTEAFYVVAATTGHKFIALEM